MTRQSKKNKKRELNIHESEDWYDSLLPGHVPKIKETVSQKSISNRIMLISVIIILAMLAIVARLFFMQVVDAESYNALANGNRVRLEVEYAPRGKILDANGEVLASNTSAFQITVTPYLMAEDPKARQADYKIISGIIDKSYEEVKTKATEKGLDFVQPLIIADSLTHDQARLLDAASELKGFSVDAIPIREYDPSAGMAHIVGYTGRVDPDDLESNDKLLPADFIGKSGVEQYYDGYLRGQNGWQRIEVDALGRPVRILGKQEPIAGKDLTLSIDKNVQIAMTSAVEQQMQKANVSRASGVAVDPQTGQVIAIVSVPSYDNNLFAQGISSADFSNLVNSVEQPLYNKAIGGGYSSGSTIKPLVASAALQEGVVDENTVINDVSALVLPGGFSFASWRPGGLGPMNVRRAIAWSSNIYFYTVGGGYGGIEGLGHPRLQEYYRQFGLGELSGIDLPNENPGRVPDEKWKLEQTGEYWYQGDSYNLSIGQGDLLISPLQLAMAHSAVANDGYVLSPRVKADSKRTVRRELAVDKQYLQIVREGMRQVLTGGTTCECTFSKVPVQVAGKSGTAETNTPAGKRPHAWYSAFAPYENPEILVTVLLEEGVGGSQFAAPAIASTMEEYFKDFTPEITTNQ